MKWLRLSLFALLLLLLAALVYGQYQVFLIEREADRLEELNFRHTIERLKEGMTAFCRRQPEALIPNDEYAELAQKGLAFFHQHYGPVNANQLWHAGRPLKVLTLHTSTKDFPGELKPLVRELDIPVSLDDEVKGSVMLEKPDDKWLFSGTIQPSRCSVYTQHQDWCHVMKSDEFYLLYVHPTNWDFVVMRVDGEWRCESLRDQGPFKKDEAVPAKRMWEEAKKAAATLNGDPG